jgi:zinc and cadmium transporter
MDVIDKPGMIALHLSAQLLLVIYCALVLAAALAGGWLILAVVLHKPFGAMAISTLMTAEGCSRFLRQIVNWFFALVTPVGALVFFFGVDYFAGASEAAQGNALAFCAGTFLCIACADLLPELQFHSHDRFKLSLGLLAGLALAVLLGYFGHAHPDPHLHQAMPATPITGQPAKIGVPWASNLYIS